MRLSIALWLGLLVPVVGTSPIVSTGASAVHEWGTFTSVAGEDGSAEGWRPLYGPSDLPCFVHHLDQRNLKLADYGTVRMETPVLYFYPSKPMVVSVHVGFSKGRITEWYPQASGVQASGGRDGWIEWNQVQLRSAVGLRRGEEALPQFDAASHYYAARKTSAWPLQSQGEREKMLFYRGIAYFDVGLRATVQADGVSLRNADMEAIPVAILFQNHAGKISYHVMHGLQEPAKIKFSALNGSMNDLRERFEAELIEMGLYRDEARAMVETWRDSWFEDGLRVFYILPRSKVDALLPLIIKPAPEQLARVFVGRVELLSQEMSHDIGAALATGDVALLKSRGRFLDAFLKQIGGGPGNPPMSREAQLLLDESDRQIAAESLPAVCK